jgi:hypothetical protein
MKINKQKQSNMLEVHEIKYLEKNKVHGPGKGKYQPI